MTLSRAQRLALATATLAAAFALPLAGHAAIKTPADKFVRTANYYLRAGTDITAADYPALAKYDLLVLPAEAQVYNRTMFPRLRELNPSIIILAYVPSKSWNYAWSDSLHEKLRSGIEDSWWLTDSRGNRVSVWPNTSVISGVSPWNAYLPRFVKDEIWSTGLWDGVFYDEFSGNASWMNNGDVDIHRDGIRDDAALLDVAWQRGMINMLKATRDALGPNAIIVTNGDSTDALQKDINGRMFETFPTPWEAGGTWDGVMANYLRLHKQVGHSPVFIINGRADSESDYRKARYGLASTLMGDGFFSFDMGEESHGQMWHFDEQDVRLGRPIGEAVNALAPGDKRVRTGVWRRDFQDGVALVNATDSPKTVNLGGELEKLRGTQDPHTNDGAVVTSVTIPPNDGLLLMKRVETVTDAVFPNGAFVRLFNPQTGSQLRNGFFSYDPEQDGSAAVANMDVDGDGAREKVTAGGGRVSVYRADGSLHVRFAPYGDAYAGPINLAVGDVDGDAKAEIVTGAGPGGGPQVRVFNRDGKALGPGFFAYDKNFRGGVHVAVGDVYGTGRPVIVTGAGLGGGPHVRIFSRTGAVLNGGWFAYDRNFRGGVRVAVGDLDGDGKAEIVTGAGPGGGPHVRTFNRFGTALGKGFFAADPGSRSGVNVAVADVDGDGKAEIATMTTDVFQFSAVGR